MATSGVRGRGPRYRNLPSLQSDTRFLQWQLRQAAFCVRVHGDRLLGRMVVGFRGLRVVHWVPHSSHDRSAADDQRNENPEPTPCVLFSRRGVRVRTTPAVTWAIGWLRRLPPVLGRGYIECDKEDRPTASISPGHAAAFVLLALTSLAYYVLGRWGVEQLERGQTLPAPALCYLLLLFTMLCWLLSSLSFFFDRYHIPVLVPLVVVILLASNWGDVSADHFYQTEVPTRLPKSKTSSPGSIVVVAANGGGIQSAAWTARVLTGLEQKCRE